MVSHQDSKHVVPHDESEAVDLHSNQLGDRHHFVVHHLVPLYILHLDSKGHQVGAFQFTALGECVGAGALEIKSSPIKRAVMGVTRGMAHSLTNRVTFLYAIVYFTLLIWATCELLALNLRKTVAKQEKCYKNPTNDFPYCKLTTISFNLLFIFI